ncbi:hypothetical protein [Tengunoibacter tsumagoiensis]|uniref:DUF2878 domain-containing protein n=1 Tax=Tengunoibacter tsumagoiensis TaxID=2014871 RepID=A0A401ZTD9_9CHLR|nr:hypothetical protein [Tengunoibacter tsumagoiensis]GCE10145.1 hypothetical protein KTT_00040 [Tengunoibacter tsumagoiensis]
MEFLTLTAPYLVILYAAVLLFIRPTRAAWLASLLAGLLMGIINIVGDLLAYSAHWWHYSFHAMTFQSVPAYLLPVINAFNAMESNWHISLPFYLTPVLIFGSLGYLFVWRFWRSRAHWVSLVALVAVPLFCIVRDILGGVSNTSFQIWENVPAAIIATVVMWLVAFFAGFLLFWFLAPARSTQEEELTTLGEAQVHKQ